MCHLCEERSYDGRRSTAAQVAPATEPSAAPKPGQPAGQVRK